MATTRKTVVGLGDQIRVFRVFQARSRHGTMAASSVTSSRLAPPARGPVSLRPARPGRPAGRIALPRPGPGPGARLSIAGRRSSALTRIGCPATLLAATAGEDPSRASAQPEDGPPWISETKLKAARNASARSRRPSGGRRLSPPSLAASLGGLAASRSRSRRESACGTDKGVEGLFFQVPGPVAWRAARGGPGRAC